MAHAPRPDGAFTGFPKRPGSRARTPCAADPTP
jgi:hypothetical protein